jgi:hypothetical protein
MKEVAVGGEYKLSLCRPKFPTFESRANGSLSLWSEARHR